MIHPPIPLPLNRLVPPPSLFVHPSRIHGQSHVARVMVHAFRLIEATGWVEEAPRLWAAVYLHDLARTHDGLCYRHGGDAMKQFGGRDDLRPLFAQGGVVEDDYPFIHTAVVHHSLPKELDRTHPHWRLAALMKDADGLDRVRLGDLDPRYLRHEPSAGMVDFAESLYRRTHGVVSEGERHFEALLEVAGLA
ncbi:MAG: hypothetical protein AB7P99_15915 [Vicinamibacterales bacterium]